MHQTKWLIHKHYDDTRTSHQIKEIKAFIFRMVDKIKG